MTTGAGIAIVGIWVCTTLIAKMLNGPGVVVVTGLAVFATLICCVV